MVSEVFLPWLPRVREGTQPRSENPSSLSKVNSTAAQKDRDSEWETQVKRLRGRKRFRFVGNGEG